MFLSASEIDLLPWQLQQRDLLKKVNEAVREAKLGMQKELWFDGLPWLLKQQIVQHLVNASSLEDHESASSLEDLVKGLKALQRHEGVLPTSPAACARFIECLMVGVNPAALHLEPSHAALKILTKEQAQMYSGLEGRLFSALADHRLEASRTLRMDDSVYTDGQGAIPARFIRLNREAIRSLIGQIKDGEAMFSLERGGALVADHILNLTERGILNFKIPKIDPDRATLRVPESVRRNDPWWVYKQNYDDPKYQRDEHARRFQKSIKQFLLAANKSEVKIVITETLVGGASARKIMDQVNKLLGKYPKLEIKVLLHRHTLHGNKPTGKHLELYEPHKGFGPVTLFEGESSELARKLSLFVENIPAPYEHRSDKDLRPVYNKKTMQRASVAIARGEYILGEDVGYQLAYEGENAHQPVVIFSESPIFGVCALQLVPRGPMTARDILLKLVEGAYDHVLAQYGLEMELGSYERPGLSSTMTL